MAHSRAFERLAAGSAVMPGAPPGLYDPLLGAWDVEWRAFDGRGRPGPATRGEWHFERVFGGRGVQDVIWPSDDGAWRDGTTLRCWDAELKLWRVAFMCPGDGEFVTLIARPSPDGIRQEVVAPVAEGARREWNFSEIERDSFLWQARASVDGGVTWRTTHEIRARRQA